MPKSMSGKEIRQSFIDFFVKKHGHTNVPSASLVPAKDATLLFTNSGMVQFVDVFLGTGTRRYSRAVNSQKCLRVAGKHNDLEDVGENDTHHTFFEMLGSWSFGDYYKKEAIAWAWELLTEVWGLPKERLYASVFKDEKGEIPTDDEAAKEWLAQEGFDASHLAYLGRKFNFWEMAETGPCGPNSEIHIDLGDAYGEITYLEDGQVDLDGPRFVELWNLVFIQYNRSKKRKLDPLPSMHVDTGLGFERIVSVLQGVDSNYRTDLFAPIIAKIQMLAGHDDKEVKANFTPYRVIADHARAAAFLIADGVVPGNIGRNYVSRMIIRRAARFGSKIGLNEAFLAEVAEAVLEQYGEAYPELIENRKAIIENLTLEEERFKRTVESGLLHLDDLLDQLSEKKSKKLGGEKAFDLHATYGLPLEITRDIARERNLEVDEAGFQAAMEKHRIASGAGQALLEMGGEEAELYRQILDDLQKEKKLSADGVAYDPYSDLMKAGEILAIVSDGKALKQAKKGDKVAIMLPETAFYVASGGQVSDSGSIQSADGKKWLIDVQETFRPSVNVVVHVGVVREGSPKVGDQAIAQVDAERRQDIIRNHTATHLLHAALHEVVGDHARQAGSLVAPDRLRFDFNHNAALTKEEVSKIEERVNQWVLQNHELKIEYKSLEKAKAEGAIALFGEKYAEEVRTIQIGDHGPFSYELCGGTHVRNTGDIGTFMIVSEGSAASGIRRIEAITGRAAYQKVSKLIEAVSASAQELKVEADKLPQRIRAMQKELKAANKELDKIREEKSKGKVDEILKEIPTIDGVAVLAIQLEDVGADTLRNIADQFRQQHPSGVALLAGVQNGKAALIAAVTKDLNKRGLHAGELVKKAAEMLGGSGGGRPDLAQAGGKDIQNLDKALAMVTDWVKDNLK